MGVEGVLIGCRATSSTWTASFATPNLKLATCTRNSIIPPSASSLLLTHPILFSRLHQVVSVCKIKMLRAGAVRALYAATRTQVPRQLPAFRSQISTSLLQSSRITPSFVVPSIRYYSAHAGLSKDEVQGRIMDLLKNFDKVSSDDTSLVTFLLLTLPR